MTRVDIAYDQLIDELILQNALIVHCSRPGKAYVPPSDQSAVDETPNNLLFPDDLHRATALCDAAERDVSCSVVWPDNLKTFGAVGIVLRPRSIASITRASPTDAGTIIGPDGKRIGPPGTLSRALMDKTFANRATYNEWTVTDADTIGIFTSPTQPLEVARIVDLTKLANYDPMWMPAWEVAPQPITPREVMRAFPSLRAFTFHEQQIVQIGNSALPTRIAAAALYRT